MRHHNHPSSRGFTLIELLVVVFILSLSAGVLLINISFGSIEDEIKQETIRLQHLLRFAHEQSVIRAKEYGVRFHQTGYRFMTFEKNLWIDLVSDRHLTARELENDMEFEIYIEGVDIALNSARKEAELIKEQQDEEEERNESNDDTATNPYLNVDPDNIYSNHNYIKNPNQNNVDVVEEQKIKPHIYLLSSGELSPGFVGRIRIPGEDIYFDIKGTPNGVYELVKPDDFSL